jgi:hypothetical protein
MRRLVMTAMSVVCAVSSAQAQAQMPPPALMRVTAEEDIPRFAWYWEGGGNALFTGNLDVLVTERTSVRVGGLTFPVNDDPQLPWAAVVTVNRLFGDCGNFLEVGVGWVGLHRWGFDENETVWAPTATIGYRRQTRTQFVRFGLTAPPPRPNEQRHHAVLGLSFGRAF